GRTPHVVDRVLIAGIVLGEALCDGRPEVGEIRQLLSIQLLENAGLDLALEEISGRHDDVIAGFAGQELRLQRIVGVERIVADPDSGLLGEVFDDTGRDVVGPVVDVDDARARWLAAGRRYCERRGCNYRASKGRVSNRDNCSIPRAGRLRSRSA